VQYTNDTDQAIEAVRLQPFFTGNSNMCKQAMGQSSSDVSSQVDTNSHLLCYPSMPLVKTMTLNWLRAEQYSAGTMLRSLIACYDGFNQEDAITLNQKSLDLGLFRSYQTSCVTLQEKKRGSMNTIERFGKPSRFTTLGMKSGSYEQLDRDGFLFPGTPVNNNDVLIGRILPINKTSPTANVHIAKLEVNGEGEGANAIDYDKMGFMCTSIMASQKTSGVVLDTIVTSDIHGMKKVKVRILKTCVFILGDKASSRHGQKGVMGISRPSKEFPFTARNHIPDLILNPQSIPSRMTVGHILELLFGQALLYNRKRGDTTAFTHSYATSLDIAELYAEDLLSTGAALGNANLGKLDINDRMDTIARFLRHKGHHSSGNERMYNGKVGATLGGTCACALASACPISPFHPASYAARLLEQPEYLSRGWGETTACGL
jgi:DNA-directed RNA polymerase II subunit RPB2